MTGDRSRIRASMDKITEVWPFFNRWPLGSRQILEWAQRQGILCSEDVLAPCGYTFLIEESRYIHYDPNLPEVMKVLVLGHEMGHHLLEHLGGPDITGDSLEEWEANIIAYSALIPDTVILPIRFRASNVGHQWLYERCLPLWNGIPEEEAMHVCRQRIEIFHELWVDEHEGFSGQRCRRNVPSSYSYVHGRVSRL